MKHIALALLLCPLSSMATPVKSIKVTMQREGQTVAFNRLTVKPPTLLESFPIPLGYFPTRHTFVLPNTKTNTVEHYNLIVAITAIKDTKISGAYAVTKGDAQTAAPEIISNNIVDVAMRTEHRQELTFKNDDKLSLILEFILSRK